MDMKLELVPIPVSDINRAKAFYVEGLGFNEDKDLHPAEGVRVVQLTPPGSGCSIVLGDGLPRIAMQPGSVRGLHLVVDDIHAARDGLSDRGVPVEEVEEPMEGVKYAPFRNPDGNTWTLQEIAWRAA
jgi:catechol 2,3-dioxygenase-like lactoylglutathione lyase family enzyme